MKSFEVIFKNGHFYDANCAKELKFQEGERYLIIGENETSIKLENRMKDYSFLTGNDKLLRLKEQHPEYMIEKALDAGASLYFYINLPNRKKANKKERFLFKIVIQEDLYFKRKSNKSNWTACDCICQVTESLTDPDIVVLPFQRDSLNKLYADFVSHHFEGMRSTAINIFNSIYLDLDLIYPLDNKRNSKKVVKLNL